ncbi:ABC transporter ATP-binding protein [Streptomyces malaysiensis]|uniref:Abc transporter atp-binding protein n=1 Tax=Streptomyces malaysiensis TaxID=92644 RepID=A0A7X6B0X2_STRMQ|nr:ABC transporter ATP-binding protein [Streptomyces malaysiensis]NIY69006.1 abc transporter atp-binding protein [Streptomyces malaysiensis]
MTQHSMDKADGGRSRGGSGTVRGVSRRHHALLLSGVLVGLAGVAASLAQPYAIGELVKAAGRDEALVGPVGLLVALFCVGGVFSALEGYLIGRAGENIVLDVRELLVGRLLRADLAAYNKHPQGDILTRTVTDTSLVKIALSQSLAQLVISGATIVGGVVLMITVDAWLLLITLSCLGGASAVCLGLARNVHRAAVRNREHTGAFGSDVQRVLSALPTVKASRAEERETGRIGVLARRARDSGVRVNALSALLTPAVNVGTQGALAVVIGVGMSRVAGGEMSMADLTTFIMYLFQLVSPLVTFFLAVGEFQQGRAAMQRVDELTLLPQEGEEGERPGRQASFGSPARARGAVEFHRVRFTYPGEGGARGGKDGGQTLSEVSFEVPARGLTAIVGPSGAGKTTLFQLVERFYRLDGGSILLGGQDIEALPLDTVRGLVGYVQQDSAAMRGTVRENLTYANPAASEADIREAVEQAGLRDVIAGLPHGLETELGDQGIGLSGGQRQRLCIARTLLQKPAVMLLDEATSNLDSDSERHFREALRQVSTQCAVVAIAHRISTVIDADKIVVMSGGEVHATGRHQDLMERDELYRRLAGSQLHAESGLIGEPVIPGPDSSPRLWAPAGQFGPPPPPFGPDAQSWPYGPYTSPYDRPGPYGARSLDTEHPTLVLRTEQLRAFLGGKA